MNAWVSGRCSPDGAVALVEVRHGVEPEAVEAEVEPEADEVDHGVGHFGVLVVEVGLVVVEAVPVVLLAGVVPRPVGALDVGEDDAGVGPLLVVVVPDVPVGLGVVPRRARLDEPRVLVAGVVHHQVGDDPDAAAVGVLQEGHQVADAPVVGVDVEEVADVVAAVADGRRVEGQHPDAVDAQPLDVVELLAQAAQVAGAVVVGVVEAADEHLVEDGVLEPARRGVEGALAAADRDGRRAHGVTARRRSPCRGRARGTTRSPGPRPRCGPPRRRPPARCASPSASVPSRPRSTAALARPCATSGPLASSAAQASAASSTSSGATTRLTRPIASASSARTWRPVKISSLARDGRSGGAAAACRRRRG